MNATLLVWETEEKYESKNEQFKQAMVQAFPSLYKDIYEIDKEDSLDGYEQIVSDDQEEFVSITDFLDSLHTMSTEELVDFDG
jgi:hypothetical protein